MNKKILLAILPLSIFAGSFNAPMQTYVDTLKAEAKKADSSFKNFDITRGKKIFTTKHLGKKGKQISCSSCHTKNLSNGGKNEHTGKLIDPLSPKTNPKRLTVVKDVKKWLRRNFNDVYVRVGTAKEKGDVLYYINSK
jgi:cytochrome c peroxidase